MPIKSQGTELFVIDTISSSGAAVVKLVCPTGVSGLGGPRDQLETTCLDALEDKTFLAGLGNPGQVTVPFNLDPQDTSHQALFAWKADGSNMDWVMCLSEAATDPTLNSSDGFNLPTDRTTIEFSAYVADVNLDVVTNDIVKGTLLLQRSGAVTFTPAST
jgi:hypothetical protein